MFVFYFFLKLASEDCCGRDEVIFVGGCCDVHFACSERMVVEWKFSFALLLLGKEGCSAGRGLLFQF